MICTVFQSFVIAVLVYPSLVATAAPQFASWYPYYRIMLKTIVSQNCSVEYQTYLADNLTEAAILEQWTPSERQWFQDEWPNYAGEPMTNCILHALPEDVKSNMGAAAVLLGLTPTILSTISSTTAKTALLTLVARRPLLTLLLSAGSPAVAPLRPFQYPDPSELLLPRNQGAAGFDFPRYEGWGKMVVAVLEYVLAAGSMANVVEIGYRLGYQTINSIVQDNLFSYLIWTLGAVVIHALGCLSFWLRIRVDATHAKPRDVVSWKRSVLDYLSREFSPAAYADPPNLERSRSTLPFLVAAWFTETGSVVNLFWGTIVFSATQFLGTRDATKIVACYLASIVCCRMVVAYEMAGLRHAYAQQELPTSWAISSKEHGSATPVGVEAKREERQA